MAENFEDNVSKQSPEDVTDATIDKVLDIIVQYTGEKKEGKRDKLTTEELEIVVDAWDSLPDKLKSPLLIDLFNTYPEVAAKLLNKIKLGASKKRE